jgi:predicted metal-binding protein
LDPVSLCLELGATKAERIPVEQLVFQPELRRYCEQNACGRYGKNYTCPPYIGDTEALIAKVRGFRSAVIFQNIYALEDSFDFEGMMEAQRNHNEMTRAVARRVYAERGRENALVLAAGGCTLCERCGAPDGAPCPGEADALASLEAYCINVSQVENVTGMKYINGQDTVTYFSGIFWTD